jgi:hypothetical protein
MRDETEIDNAAARADRSSLNGRWDAQLGGLRLPDDVLAELTLLLQSGTFVFGSDSGVIAVDADTARLHSTS